MTPDPTVQDETANNSDDSPADRIQGDHADQQECEHHQGSAALTVAVRPRDHNSGNGPMFDLSNLRLLCQSHHHRIERELKRERHDHQRPPKIIF